MREPCREVAYFFNAGDFEAELAAWPRPHARTAIGRAIDRELGPCCLVLGRAEDSFIVEEPIDGRALAPLGEAGIAFARPVTDARGCAERLVPWGAAPSALVRARALGLACEAPAVEIVRRVNSKLWSHALERELGCGLAGAAAVRSEDEARAAIAAARADRWVLKAPFGVAGRGRFPGRGADLEADGAAWVRRALAREEALLFEPWVEVAREFGLQLEIAAGGGARILGATESIVDRGGHYVGSRIGGDPPPELYLEVALEAGRRLAREGYFGPAGIDAFELAGGALRPIVEINARFTMGMVALAFLPLVAPGGAAAWILLPRRVAARAGAAELVRRAGLGPYRRQTGEGALAASPNGRAIFLAAKTRAALEPAERAIMQAGR